MKAKNPEDSKNIEKKIIEILNGLSVAK